jgi:hypothetical protein
MRNCPVCTSPLRNGLFSMRYKIPDGWTLPHRIGWYTCSGCKMIYGDGDFNQAMLDEYYKTKYGYGVNNPANIQRLKSDAAMIADMTGGEGVIVDFGGAGDDGTSVLVDELQRLGVWGCVSTGAGDALPEKCDVIYASHVVEHIYDLPETMLRLTAALATDGTLIVDGPDAMGLLQHWQMPILDFNTKHINHFTLRNYLDLGHCYGFEMVRLKQYALENAPAYQLHFKRLNVADASERHVLTKTAAMMAKLREIREPVNVWGLGDISWHLLAHVDLDVLDYIDNDPAYRDATYNGKSVQERPTNDAPIVIVAQGQRGRLIENIRKAGVTNPIIEI